MSSFKEHRPKCTYCSGVCSYTYVPTVPLVSFLDGPSGSWTGKVDRVQKFRQKASEDASKRQFERYGKREMIPNYKGQETGTWAEAQFQAEKDSGIVAAASYEPKVQAEKAKKDT